MYIWNGIKIYVDGKLEDITSYSNPINSNPTENVYIGQHREGSPTNKFTGQIDEVKVFNYALTQKQIENEYNAGAVRFGQ